MIKINLSAEQHDHKVDILKAVLAVTGDSDVTNAIETITELGDDDWDEYHLEIRLWGKTSKERENDLKNLESLMNDLMKKYDYENTADLMNSMWD